LARTPLPPISGDASTTDSKNGEPSSGIRWREDNQLSSLLLLILTSAALYLTYIIFRPFLTALFLALLMAIGFFPVHKRVIRKIRNRSAAALMTTTVAIVLIMVPIAFVSFRFANQATSFYSSVLRPLGNPGTWPLRLDPLITRVAHEIGTSSDNLKTALAGFIRQLGVWSVRFATSLSRRFAQQILTMALAFTFLYSLLRSIDEFRAGIFSLLPVSPLRARELARAVNQGVIADIYGMFAVGVAEGGLIAIAFWLTGLGTPLIWGAVAAVLSFIPFVGVALVWFPGSVVLALKGNWANAIILFLWGWIVISIAEGWVRSRVVGRRMRINSLLISVSTAGGLVTFGPIGIFVGPVILVLAATLIRILREEHASTTLSGKPV